MNARIFGLVAAIVLATLAGCSGSPASDEPSSVGEPVPADPVKNETQPGSGLGGGADSDPEVPRRLPPLPPLGTDPLAVTYRSLVRLEGAPGGPIVGGRCALDAPEPLAFPALSGTPLEARLQVMGGDGWAAVAGLEAISYQTTSTGDDATGSSSDPAIFGAVEGEGQLCLGTGVDVELLRSVLVPGQLPFEHQGSVLTILEPLEIDRGGSQWAPGLGWWTYVTYAEQRLDSVDIYSESQVDLVVRDGGGHMGVGSPSPADWVDDVWHAPPVVTPIDVVAGDLSMDDPDHDVAVLVPGPLEYLRLGDYDDDGGGVPTLTLSGLTVQDAELYPGLGAVAVDNSTLGNVSSNAGLDLVDSVVTHRIDVEGSMDATRLRLSGEVAFGGSLDGSYEPVGNLTMLQKEDGRGAAKVEFVEGRDIGYELVLHTASAEVNMNVEVIEEGANLLHVRTPGFDQRPIQVYLEGKLAGTFDGIPRLPPPK